MHILVNADHSRDGPRGFLLQSSRARGRTAAPPPQVGGAQAMDPPVKLTKPPKTLRYEHDGGLPVAIEAKSNRRTYLPNNGQTFLPGQTIRINLNSQSFLDFSHSYLQFKWTNKTGGGLTNLETARSFQRFCMPEQTGSQL